MADNTTGGGRGERTTGTPNTVYDRSSVLFHASEGGASYDTYIEDAEREGDQELADFLRGVRDEDSMRADEAQWLLVERTPTTTAGRPEETATLREGVAAEPTPRTEPFGAPPREEDIPPRRMEEVPPTVEGMPPGASPLGNVQRETSPELPPRTAEALSPEQERAGEREEHRRLVERARDALTDQEEEPNRRREEEPRGR